MAFKKRRGYIEKRAKDKFRIRVELGEVNGKRIRQYHTVHTSEAKIAEQELTRLLTATDARPSLQPAGLITVKDWVAAWLEDREQDKIRPIKMRTVVTYKEHMQRYVIPFIGNVRLKNLTKSHLQKLYNSLMNGDFHGQKPLSQVSVKHVHVALGTALTYAEQEGKLIRSPHRDIRWARLPEKDMVIPTGEQIKALLSQARTYDGMPPHTGGMYHLIYMALETGARRGELLALRWNDIDFERLTLRIRFNLHRHDGEAILGTPKNGESRTIDISSDLRVLLEERHAQQLIDSRLTGLTVKDSTPVFTDAFLNWHNPTSVSNRFKEIRDGLIKEQPDLDFPEATTFHSLRHTHASYTLADSNAKVNTIMALSQRLGHKDVTTTMKVYAHLLQDTVNLADKFQDIMRGILGAETGAVIPSK